MLCVRNTENLLEKLNLIEDFYQIDIISNAYLINAKTTIYKKKKEKKQLTQVKYSSENEMDKQDYEALVSGDVVKSADILRRFVEQVNILLFKLFSHRFN